MDTIDFFNFDIDGNDRVVKESNLKKINSKLIICCQDFKSSLFKNNVKKN